MLKIKISKNELKNLYLGKSTSPDKGEEAEYTTCEGDDKIPNAYLNLLKIMLDILKDNTASARLPDL
ncbi:MAG: hypothetical protein PHV32_14320 [Eubacteriales bacterium]|nr:hypothetical protein [Clostridia bacterium]MDD4495488.1 hypothetical protein [Eubacteriales bacterium]